jgi:hypothetical protein
MKHSAFKLRIGHVTPAPLKTIESDSLGWHWTSMFFKGAIYFEVSL